MGAYYNQRHNHVKDFLKGNIGSGCVICLSGPNIYPVYFSPFTYTMAEKDFQKKWKSKGYHERARAVLSLETIHDLKEKARLKIRHDEMCGKLRVLDNSTGGFRVLEQHLL